MSVTNSYWIRIRHKPEEVDLYICVVSQHLYTMNTASTHSCLEDWPIIGKSVDVLNGLNAGEGEKAVGTDD